MPNALLICDGDGVTLPIEGLEGDLPDAHLTRCLCGVRAVRQHPATPAQLRDGKRLDADLMSRDRRPSRRQSVSPLVDLLDAMP